MRAVLFGAAELVLVHVEHGGGGAHAALPARVRGRHIRDAARAGQPARHAARAHAARGRRLCRLGGRAWRRARGRRLRQGQVQVRCVLVLLSYV